VRVRLRFLILLIFFLYSKAVSLTTPTRYAKTGSVRYTRPHALTLHIHIPITVLVLYYNDLALPFSFFLITSAR